MTLVGSKMMRDVRRLHTDLEMALTLVNENKYLTYSDSVCSTNS